MTTIKQLLTTAALVGFTAIQASAAIVLYSDNFSGNVANNLHATTPDTTIGTNTWTAQTNWKANGSIAGTGTAVGAADHSAFLAFTPTTGMVYTLSATLAKPAGTGGGMWAGIGFTNNNLTGNFFGGTNNASPWMIYRAEIDQIATFGGPGTTNGSGNLSGYTGSQTMTIVLDTTGAQWEAEWFVGAVSVDTFTYTTNPTISFIGLGRENGAGADFSSFSLTAVPEPSTALLGGLGGLLLLLRRRRN